MTTIAYQLYCSRNAPSVDGTLKMLAETGYTAVEGYGGLFDDVPALRAGLDRHGLSMPSSHIGLDLLNDDTAKAIEICAALGITKAICPHIAEAARPTDAAGWAALGKRFAEKSKPLRDAGLTVGWHNHEFEFADIGGEERPMDLILQGSDDLKVELDIGWVVRAGLDPVEWINKYGARITAAHIKDIAPEGEALDEDGWADVGHGTQDWPPIVAALARAGCTHFVAEHDKPGDDARFARRSLSTIQTF